MVPEGHTIHRLSKDLTKDLDGRRVIATSPQGRFENGASKINGKAFNGSEAWGKHLFLMFSGNAILHIHLGLIGKFRPVSIDSLPTDTVRLRLEGKSAWQLTGPQKCSLISSDEYSLVIDALGPDPLRRSSRVTDFEASLKKRKTPIAISLLDQSVIAGGGNVYRAEFLFMLGIHPNRPSCDLTSAEVREIWELATQQLRQGVRLNRIVTVTEQDSGKKPGHLRRSKALYVYKRETLPCRRCGSPIRIAEFAGRSCWWCDRCQPI